MLLHIGFLKELLTLTLTIAVVEQAMMWFGFFSIVALCISELLLKYRISNVDFPYIELATCYHTT